MKILSEYKELEGTTFESIEACAEAEAKVEEERKAIAAKEKEQSKIKKRLSNDVEKAEQAVTKAFEDYEQAKIEAKKILDEANKKASEVLASAKKKVTDAESARSSAIQVFTANCGPYQKIYTGERARKEFDRLNQYMTTMFDDIWSIFGF